MTKRTVSLFVAVCLSFSLIIFKIISLSYSSYADAGNTSGSKTLTVGTTRGNIYDCNMNRLVNSQEKLIAVARPSAQAIAEVKAELSEKEAESVIKNLSAGYPTMFEVKKEISTDDINTFRVPVRYSEDLCAGHIIGYLDGEGNGVSGIEKAYNELLSSANGTLSVSFAVDASGRDLNGITPVINDNNFDSPAGVVLTIDKDIQQIAEKAMDRIESGACVVLASDGSIAASVSRPGYDAENVALSLKSENAPLVNKAFKAYSVGSVFKPILAAYAVENNIKTNDSFECTGEITVGDTSYGCFGRTPHGKINFKRALCVSCNSYFINMTRNFSPRSLSSFCSNFSLGSEAKLAPGIVSDGGFLPDEKELQNAGNLANFSFGQGSLTASPLQLASAYLAIANGGEYMYPSLIRGTVDANGVFTKSEAKPSSFILSEKTGKKMRSLLQNVVTDGNAYLAEAKLCTTAGKTGTAQSGSYDENGDEILRTWFVGFFPASNPMYAVAVLNENGTSGGKDCCPVFSEIADSVMELVIERANSPE